MIGNSEQTTGLQVGLAFSIIFKWNDNGNQSFFSKTLSNGGKKSFGYRMSFMSICKTFGL